MAMDCFVFVGCGNILDSQNTKEIGKGISCKLAIIAMNSSSQSWVSRYPCILIFSDNGITQLGVNVHKFN